MPRNLHARCVRYFQFAKGLRLRLACRRVKESEYDDDFLAFTENAVDAQRLALQARGVFVV